MEASERFLELSRFWVQRVLVPILVLVGAGGNIVTVMVLTRRRMRCSTNIYLTALAVADLVYLLFVLVLSFEHYPNIHDIRYELYWRFYGINHWLADAASSASIWLVVCFTIERYIAVCHPIRGKVLCTENRAKRVISAVSILCILSTISTSFEYQLTTSSHCVQKTCETKIQDVDSTTSNLTMDEQVTEINNLDIQTEDAIFDLSQNVSNCQELCDNSSAECKQLLSFCLNNSLANETDDCCVVKREIQTEHTNLGRNVTYRTIFYWFTSITFTFLPLTLIATFNCFLVNAVRNSQKQRKQMTKSQENSTQAQEHRMTVILICVVILFLICQTPSACYLIYSSVRPKLDTYTDNVLRGLGNVFNLLVSINAACNFLLYCALSEKYRRTFRTLFCSRRASRHDTLTNSRTRSSTRFGGSPGSARAGGLDSATNKNGFRRNASAYVPRNYETQRFNSIPRAKTVIVRPADKRPVGKFV